MSGARTNKGMKIGWIGGFAGGTLWMLLLSILRFTQGQNYRGLFWIACFGICVEVAWMLLPWRRPDSQIRRLYFASVTPIVLAALIMLYINVLAEGTVAWSLFLGLFVLYLPVLTLGRKTWRDIVGE